jgi:dGTPase
MAGTAGWAGTMRGFSGVEDDGLRYAHREGSPSIGARAPLGREEREAVEALTLAEGATRARDAGRREREEAPDPLRTCFERDRDRILHSPAFRRLAGKTQVFVFPADHQRTRLTHALEVAQVATAVARACRLNVALAEAIALGHDCGHGPGGHASEEAFAPYLDEGFDHAVFGADVVVAGLNLCAETLDGIRNHSWSRPAPSTPEGVVVSWADRIAYSCHDLEDACRAGVVSTSLLPRPVTEVCGTGRSEQLRIFVEALITSASTTGRLAMPTTTATALAALREFNYTHIYQRPDSVTQSKTVISMLRALVEHFAGRPDEMPADAAGGRRRGVPPGATDGTDVTDSLRAAVSYIAGMTDRYACRTAIERLGWPESDLPRGVDVALRLR